MVDAKDTEPGKDPEPGQEADAHEGALAEQAEGGGGAAAAVAAAEAAEAIEAKPSVVSAARREPAPSDRLKSIVESLLFVSDRPVTSKELGRALRTEEKKIRATLEALTVEWAGRGVVLAEVAGGYQLRSSTDNAQWVQHYLQVRPVRLSRASLETLAIIAYRQPLTRPEVDDLRGVDTGGVLKLLLDRGLIKIIGKKDEPGRPLLYGTTAAFLELFGLKSLRDLPTLRQFTELTEESQALVEKFDDESGRPEGQGEPPEEPRDTAPTAPVDEESEAALAAEIAQGRRDEGPEAETETDSETDADSETDPEDEDEDDEDDDDEDDEDDEDDDDDDDDEDDEDEDDDADV